MVFTSCRLCEDRRDKRNRFIGEEFGEEFGDRFGCVQSRGDLCERCLDLINALVEFGIDARLVLVGTFEPGHCALCIGQGLRLARADLGIDDKGVSLNGTIRVYGHCLPH
jgi:hypothetical protein